MSLLTKFLLLSLLIISSTQAADKKLNVLLLISDDLCADLGCYHTPCITPNIDKLAAQGVLLDRAYCQFPLCGPSRCSFMSGLRPETEHVLVNGPTVRKFLPNLVTLPELFRHNGYFVARCGKVYHLGIPGQVGTPGPDDPQSWDYAFNPHGNEFPSKDDGDEFIPEPKFPQGFRRNILNGDGHDQADYQSASETIRLLNDHKDKPFFLVCGFIRPHVPEIAPKKYFDLYNSANITLAADRGQGRDQSPAPEFYHPQPDLGMSAQDCFESKRAYYATTSYMDAQLGRVVDELDRLHLRDSTLIIFMSDHGYSLGEHLAWQKMMLFENVCRVPMIVSYPNIPHPGTTAKGLVESIDLYPTVADLCQVTPPKEIEGKSFAPLLNDPTKDGKLAAFTMILSHGIQGRSVRTNQYRYTEWDQGAKGIELYDHTTDPGEHHNLSADPAQTTTLANLRTLLHTQSPPTKPTPWKKTAAAE